MQCENCRYENKASARFCAECGSRLASRCSSCGAEHDPAAKFCDQCGNPLIATADPPPPDRAVRKQVTALFADLAGATAFGEQVDPETARSALAPYFEILRTSVGHHDGSVVKFTGDGVMAVFGLPEVAEDDALRAVAAGQEMQRRFLTFAEGIRDRHGIELGLRVGINSGELVVGADDADLVGDVLNTASRLEAACSPGRIMAGEDTWRLTRSAVEYEVLGEIRVKGKADAIATFEVAASVPQPVEDAIPFVGRSTELRRLLDAFAAARDSPNAQLVTVVGAPGVGKTRLAYELRAATEARSFDLRVERRGSTTFGPIADLLREVTDGSADGVERLVADRDDGGRLVPILQSFLGHGAARSTEESFWAVRRLLEHLADLHGPIVVVVDDIQWAEPLLWDLLDHLVEWATAPILVVALARPELRELRPELTQAGRRVAAAIALEGLDDGATRELATRLLDTDELPAELVERLPASTDGNPLFVRELVHMLVEDGTLARDGDRWRLTIDAEAIDVPPTILSLLASRVERLPDDERQVVELASVVGTEFDRGTLEAIAGADVAARLGALVDRLRRKDLVEPTGMWAGDHPVYRFHHVLVRDAAYRRLLKVRRADLHERVGHHAADSGAAGEEQDVVVAHHFEQVVRYRRELGAVDAATHELAVAAVERLRRAAEHALEREDLLSVGTCARRALDLAQSGDDAWRDELLVLGCEALLSSGDAAAATPLVRELHERSTDDRLAAWADCFRAQRWSLTDADRLREAAEMADDAAGRLDALDDQAGVAKGRWVRAACLARLGRIGECESELDLALGAARTAGDRRRTVAVLGAAPLAALWGPSPVARAGGRCLDVLRLLRITTASPAVEATSLRCQGMLEALRGRFDSARDRLESSRSTARELGLRQGLFETELFAGFVEMWSGDPVAAEPHLRAAHEGLGRLGIGADAGQAAALLARSRLRQGDLEEADALASEAVESAGQNLQTAMRSRSVLAEVRATQGRHGEARTLIDEAIEIAERADVVLDHAVVLLTAARVSDLAGDPRIANRLRERAHQLLADKGAIAPFGPLTSSPDSSDVAASTDAVDGTVAVTGPELANGAVSALRRVQEDHLTGRRAEAIARLTPGADIDQLLPDTVRRVRIHPISVCADHLALVEMRLEADDRVVELLVLVEQGADRLVSLTSFDVDQRVDAHSALLRRWAETGGPRATLELGERFSRAMASDDADAFRALLHPDFEAPDHRTIGPGDRTIDEFVRHSMSQTTGADAGNVWVERWLDHRPHVVLEVMVLGPPETRARLLAIFGVAEGRLRWFETFDLDDEDHARRRFAELSGDPPTGQPRLRNRALRLLQATEPSIEPIAVRADHLALARVADEHFVGVESEGDEIVETVRFDIAAPISALDWLDERWAATDGPAGLLRHMIATRTAIATGDSAGFRELCHPAMRLIDHRRLGPGDGSIDDFVTIAVAPELQGRSMLGVYIESFLEHTEEGALEMMAIGPPDARTTVLVVVEIVDGKLTLYESFDPDDEEHARRRYREVVGAGTNVLDHPLEAHTDRFVAHFFDDAFDDICDELFEPDFIREDRRRWVSFPDTDLAGFRAAAMASDGGTPTIRRGPVLAIRSNAYLGTAETVYPQGDSNEQLVVVVAGPTGRIGRLVVFDPDEILDAEDELDRQWVLAGGDARAAGLSARVRRATATADRRVLEEVHAPEFRSLDHRSLGLGIRDLDDWIEMLTMIGPGTVVMNAEILGHDDLVISTRSTMVSPDRASRWEFVNVWEFAHPDGPVRRQDVYGLDQLDEAMARYDEIAGGVTSVPRVAPVLSNAASRLGREMLDAFQANDREAIDRTLHPDLVSERRTDADVALGAPIEDRDSFVDGVLAMTIWTDSGAAPRTDRDVVAIRGDDLYLSHGSADFGGSEVSFLVLGERVDGRLRTLIWFEPDRLHDALDELDRRWAALGAPAPTVEFGIRYRRVYRAGTIDDLEAIIAPDHVAVDHRRLGLGIRGREDFLASMAELVGRAEAYMIDFFAVAERTNLGHASFRTSDDGSVLVNGPMLTQLDELGRLTRTELFDDDQLDAARARFAELAAEPPESERLTNAATRLGDEVLAACEALDRDALGRLLHPDFVSERLTDREMGASVQDEQQYIDGVFEITELAGGTAPPGTERRVIAVRGDDLYLSEGTVTVDGNAHSYLVLAEREDGRYRRLVWWPPERLLDAYDELDRRWASRRGPAAMVDLLIRLRAIYRWGTDEDFDAVVAPDYISVDHRPLGLGVRRRDEFLTSMADLAGNVDAYTTEFVAVQDLACLGRSVIRSSTDGSVLLDGLVLNVLDGLGRWQRTELFDDDQLDAALARFEELASEGVQTGNEAFRLLQRLATPWDHDDLDDRIVWLEPSPVAVRDDDLCLVRATTEHGAILLVVQTEGDRIRTMTRFDAGAFVAAIDELDRRWGALHDAGLQAAFVVPYRAVFLGGSIEDLETIVAPEFIAVDHRPLGLGTRRRAEWIASMQGFIGQTVVFNTDIVAVCDQALLGRVDFRTHDGDTVLDETLALSLLDHAVRLTRLELFAPDHLDQARARFDELVDRRSDQNAAFRAIGRVAIAWERRDTDLARSLVTGDFRLKSRKELRFGGSGGPDEFMALIADEGGNPDGLVSIHRLLAIRGDDLCLIEADDRYGDAHVVQIALVESRDNLVHRLLLFEPEQLHDAFDELDERWTESGAPRAVAEFCARQRHIFAHGTIEELRDFVAPDFVAVDHRPLGMGERSAEEWIATLSDLVGGSEAFTTDVIEHAERALLFRGTFRTASGELLLDGLGISATDETGRITRFETYDDDQLDLARRRFADITAQRELGPEQYRTEAREIS